MLLSWKNTRLFIPIVLGEKNWGWQALHPPPTCSDPRSLHYQVAALCFVLVLGSLVPCLPEFSSSSQTVKEDPVAADSVYTASQSECSRPGHPPSVPTSGHQPDTRQEPGGFRVGDILFYLLVLQMGKLRPPMGP